MHGKRVGATPLGRKEFIVDDRIEINGTCLYCVNVCQYGCVSL